MIQSFNLTLAFYFTAATFVKGGKGNGLMLELWSVFAMQDAAVRMEFQVRLLTLTSSENIT